MIERSGLAAMADKNLAERHIFVFPRVDLQIKILISSQIADLEKSASSTARPKLAQDAASSYRPPIGLKMFKRTVPS